MSRLMRNTTQFLLLPGLLLLILATNKLCSQVVYKNLRFSPEDAIYTTYAAALERSDYKSDIAYDLIWNNPGRTVGMSSEKSGETGLLIMKGSQQAFRTEVFESGPVISNSYCDMTDVEYEPLRNIRIKATFCVYSSNVLVQEYTITNTAWEVCSIVLIPYFMLEAGLNDPQYGPEGVFTFSHLRPKDHWMQEHQIPFTEQFDNQFIFSETPDNYQISEKKIPDCVPENPRTQHPPFSGVAKSLLFIRQLTIQPGESKTFRIARTSKPRGVQVRPGLIPDNILSINLSQVRKANEVLYARIPFLPSLGQGSNTMKKDRIGLYYSAFSLMRQCMMPAEGECSYNYYVFSRERKWGWGYGGQVFHESLAMLAYVYMDPVSAMNSQRVFMERQHQDGYINYRTGPYLNETIPYNGVKTSSAPWYSYINYEIYKVTKDKSFLIDAYESGRKLYRWFILNRDKDEDGLYEWGGDATLECVRDGLVATWDKVSKPENLEGPDLNSMLVREALSLSYMALELNMNRDAAYWKDLARKHAERSQKQLWDPETSFYYNTLLSTNGFTFLQNNDLKVKEITGFLPLWANLCSREQASSLIQTLYNPEEFWRPYGIPTLSARDDYYNPMGYWNGPVWVQWQYLIFRGLRDYGYQKLADALAEKVIDQMIWHLKNDHTFWEFYSPDDRHAGWNRTYIWAGIVARMMIDMEKEKRKK